MSADSNPPRLLIGTLCCGENEFDSCLESLDAQTFTNWDHFVLQNLSNKEAHEALYRRFMDCADDYDFFLKLDADMILEQPDVLERIFAVFDETPGLDHIEMAVNDIPSDTRIWGIHAFSNRARWQVDDELFVDPKPRIPGRRIQIKSGPTISHCADPSPEQAYLLGIHRTTKVIQAGKTGSQFDPINALAQWRYLKAVWRNFQRTRDFRFGLCILGSEHTWNGKTTLADYVSKSVDRRLPASTEELQQLLEPKWGNSLEREMRFLKVISSRIIPSLAARAMRKLKPSRL